MGMTGVWVALGTLVAGLVVGAVLRAREGRIRHGKSADGTQGASAPELPDAVSGALTAQAPVTLVQISTTFCSPCRHTHARLSALAERTDGLAHVDLDVTHQPEVAHRLGVLRTPTTIAFTPSGTELLRISGVPDTDALLDTLRSHLTH